jgi:hypothetical protein
MISSKYFYTCWEEISDEKSMFNDYDEGANSDSLFECT